MRTQQTTASLGWFFGFIALATATGYFAVGSYRNNPGKVASDGVYYYHHLVSAVYDGDLDFSNNYREPKRAWMRFGLDSAGMVNALDPVTGLPRNVFPVGNAVLWLPFWLLATAAVAVGQVFGLPWTHDPWSMPFQYMVMFSAVVYVIGGLWVSRGLLARLYPRRCVQASLLLTLFATNLIYYVTYEPSMSHAYDFFTVTLLAAAFCRALERPEARSPYVLLGLACGLHILVRPQNALTAGLFIALLVAATRQRLLGDDRLRHLARLVLCGAATLTALSPLLLANKLLFGSVFAIPQGAGFLRLTSPDFLGVLTSGRNGLFSHHPVLLVGLVGLGFLARDLFGRGGPLPWVTAGLGGGFALQVYVNACTKDWWAGHAFGQRRLISSLLLFAFGLAALLSWLQHSAPRLSRLTFPAVVIAIGSNLFLMYLYVFHWHYGVSHDVLAWLTFYGPRIVLFGEQY